MTSARAFRAALLCVVVVASGVVGARSAQAAQSTATWTGGAGSSFWGDAANWSTGVVPNNGTPAGTTYRVVIDPTTPLEVILNVPATIDAVTIGLGDGLTVADGRVLTVVNTGAGTGTITNNGTLALASVNQTTDLTISGNVTLDGTGKFDTGDWAANRVVGSTGYTDYVFTNLSNTISGAGQIGGNSINFVNRGAIVADGPAPLIINISTSPFLNRGTVLVPAGHKLSMDGRDIYRQVRGSTTVDGVLEGGRKLDLHGGTLAGTGTIQGVLANGGVVSPGRSPGTLAVTSNYRQSSKGALAVEINGTASASYDQLTVSKTVTLGGELRVTLGFAPAHGDTFTILTNSDSDAVSGEFAGLPEGAVFTVGSRQLEITYAGGTGNDVVLTDVT